MSDAPDAPDSTRAACVICGLEVRRPDSRGMVTAAAEGTVPPHVTFYFVHVDCLRSVMHPDVLKEEEPI